MTQYHTNVFLDQSAKETEIKAKINKCDLIKLIGFCTFKETTKKAKRQPTDWEKRQPTDWEKMIQQTRV